MVLLGWLFWILYGLISLLVGTLIFTLLANLIASPFYGLLAEATAKLLQKEKSYSPQLLLEPSLKNSSFSPSQNASASLPFSSNPSLKTILLLIPHSIARELRKLLHFLPWILLCGLCLIFPLTWPLFPFLWWIVVAWIFGVEYSDYHSDNQSISFKQTLKVLKNNAMMVLGFGSMVSLAMLVPGANLVVPSIAVAGGTALWLYIQSS